MSNLALKLDQTFTYGDYKNWSDGERWELIDGIAYKMSPSPRRFHQKISVEISRVIGNYLKGKPCEVYTAPFAVLLKDYDEQKEEEVKTVIEPDISVICDSFKLTDAGCTGVPDFIIEIISPSTIKRDKNEKFHLYQKHGVKEYQIIYPNDHIIEVFSLIDNQYGMADIYTINDEEVPVKILGDLTLNIEEIFED